MAKKKTYKPDRLPEGVPAWRVEMSAFDGTGTYHILLQKTPVYSLADLRADMNSMLRDGRPIALYTDFNGFPILVNLNHVWSVMETRVVPEGETDGA